MTEKKGIYSAILEVMKEVGYVQKQSSKKLSYTYASESAFLQALRPALLKHGIIAYICELPEVRTETYTTSKGTAMNRTITHGIVRFVHVESGTFVDAHATGEGADVGDKSANKAMTGLQKYALKQTFLIETGDDPDKTSSEGQERERDDQEKEEGLPDHPYKPEYLKERMQQVAKLAKAKLATGAWQPPHHGAVAGNLELCSAGEKDSEAKRHAITKYWFGWDSFNDAPECEISAIKAFLKAEPEYEGGPWRPLPMSVKEVQATIKKLDI